MADHKYRVINRLEAGGMAEVYVGEAVSVQGFKKCVAIKRVLPHLAQNESFIQMFLDEARLSAKLNHANIVSVFDISAREDTYFLIMEFVDGANLKKIMDTLHKRGQHVGLAEATYICIEACRGLSYAHELTGEDGEPLGIVHRDISPPNIMVTKRGEVKVADFGLAKAGTQLSTTDPGVVKGKFSYLSPEAAQGMEVDARADVFSLGVVLWEMLAGRRLFYGESDYATVKLVQKANIPRLATLNRDVDMAFEEVLFKALTRDPADRYQSAREFGDALAGYLFNRQLKVTSYDLANLVTAAVSEAGPAEQAKAQDLSLIDRLIQEELDDAVGIGGSGTQDRPGSLSQATPMASEANPGELEDPASWFSDDADLAASVPPPPKPAPPPPTPGGPGREPSGSWRESGVDLMSPPEAQQPAAGQPPPLKPRGQAGAGGASPVRAPQAGTGEGAAVARAGGGAAGKIVLAALVAVTLAAMAWLGTRIM